MRVLPVNQLMQIHQLLLKIEANKNLKDEQTLLPSEADDLTSLYDLTKLIEEEIRSCESDSKNKLKYFLEKRWRSIANGPLCYTKNPTYPVNTACILLANYIDPVNKNALLMPGIADFDIFGTAFNELELGEFIIDDEMKNFITLDSLIESACARLTNFERPLYVKLDNQGQTISITETELSRLGHIIKVIDTIANWYSTRRDNNNMFTILCDLRNCLLRGDVLHGGQEYNAGAIANVGIANFHAIYMLMDDDSKEQLRQFHDETYTVGSILDRLFRPAEANYEGTAYCIQILGGYLEDIIADNAEELSGLRADQLVNYETLLEIVKAQFRRDNLTPPGANQRQQLLRSQINPELTLSEHEWVVSLIAPKGSYYLPTHTKIIVEGIKDNQLFVGSYYATAVTNSTWPVIPGCLQNTGGVFNKIKVFESRGYAKIPQLNAVGEPFIEPDGNVLIKYDLLHELQQSLSRSHQVPAQNAKDMIQQIKSEARDTDFANWISAATLNDNHPETVDRITSSQSLFSLFIPYERFGSQSYLGTGKDNCVTWCERQLSVAGCGNSSAIDAVKAKPLTHVLGRF